MRASAIFSVSDFTPADVPASLPVTTATPTGVATMVKRYDGEAVGRSATLFTAAYNQETGAGTYVAMESFEGTLHGRQGTFNFVHSASTTGSDRSDEYFAIFPSSGTGDLAGITGAGGLTVDADGTHRVWFDYDLR
jgi:Protein of unknown function (DUF3224)